MCALRNNRTHVDDCKFTVSFVGTVLVKERLPPKSAHSRPAAGRLSGAPIGRPCLFPNHLCSMPNIMPPQQSASSVTITTVDGEAPKYRAAATPALAITIQSNPCLILMNAPFHAIPFRLPNPRRSNHGNSSWHQLGCKSLSERQMVERPPSKVVSALWEALL